MTSGVYLITNKINGHKYVGGSVDIKVRIQQHKRSVDIKNSVIDKAIAKYGKENFNYQIITTLPPDWKIIGKHEKYWIKFYNTFKDKKHYNLTEGGEGVVGFKYSDEYKKKKSESMLGEKNHFFGKKHSDETKKIISQKNKGLNKGISKTKESNIKRSKSISKKRNKYGFYRLTKKKDKQAKQGFRWLYQYVENGKRREISSTNFFELEKKVKAKSLEWYITDEDKAKDTIKKCGGSIR